LPRIEGGSYVAEHGVAIFLENHVNPFFVTHKPRCSRLPPTTSLTNLTGCGKWRQNGAKEGGRERDVGSRCPFAE